MLGAQTEGLNTLSCVIEFESLNGFFGSVFKSLHELPKWLHVCSEVPMYVDLRTFFLSFRTNGD